MYFAQYIAASDKKWFDEAIGEAYRKTPQVHSSRIERLDGIDVEQWPACKPGTLAIDCARTLRPVMWLEQFFALGDVLKIHKSPWYCPWCKSKQTNIDVQSVKARRKLFKDAVANAGFSITGSESVCAKEVMNYDSTALRECMMVRAARLPLDYASQLDLLGLLNGWWYYKDSGKRQHLIRTNTSIWQEAVNDWLLWPFQGGNFLMNRRRAKNSMLALGYDYTAEKASCLQQVSTGGESRVLTRVEKEIVSACDEGQGCQEAAGGSYCPEGTRCACKRPYTPKRAVTAFNTVFWFVSPLTVAVLSGGFAAATSGVSSVPAAVWSAGWFPDYIPAVIAMALASRKWFPECMCFEMTCEYDAALGACALKERKNMSASANPYNWLPMNGKKCARTSGREDKCEFQSCSKVDVQVSHGDHLFGRVGYKGADLYNCANLRGDQKSQLTFLDEWQDPSWGTVLNNTPAARSKMYERYRPLSRHDLLAPKH